VVELPPLQSALAVHLPKAQKPGSWFRFGVSGLQTWLLPQPPTLGLHSAMQKSTTPP
jgi:hypothetical protein